MPFKPRVYLSAPTTKHLNQRRADLKQGIIDRINAADCGVQEFGASGLPMRKKGGWSFAAANEVMRRCDGTLVLGLARTFFSSIDFARYQDRLSELSPNQAQALMEMVVSETKPRAAKAGSVPPSTLEKWLAPRTKFRTIYDHIRKAERKKAEELGPSIIPYPSPFNHFEGGLAIALDLPLLIVAEEDMEMAGILHHGSEHFICEIPVDADVEWLDSKDFTNHFGAWIEDVRGRRDVFLGYCSKANETAHAIRDHLEGQEYRVLDWQRDFPAAGPTILEEIHRAILRCRCAIFLFTADDPLEGEATAESVPRDNVVLEAGCFIQARGKERVAIIRETGAKMPADLGGIIYLSLKDRSKLGPIQDRLVQFLGGAL